MSQESVRLQVPEVPIDHPDHYSNSPNIMTMFKYIEKYADSKDNRIGAIELIVPPHTSGPPAHWHEMHDETFLVTKGTIRFHVPVTPSNPTEKTIDAKEGDYVVVPTRSPHTFSNPTGGESRFFNTFTPAFYVNYFKLMAQMAEEAGGLTPEINKKAMASFATLPLPG
ncbi:MAG: hypothetical protein M1820_009224 [Bogoriella megaspora]|nr:MAG: hypothetical protein M1820_009224 [Bogoriella megaspora]